MEKDSSCYLKMLFFIKEHGVDSFDDFVKYLFIIKEKSKSDLLNEYIFCNFDVFQELNKNGSNREIISFLKTFKNGFLTGTDLLSKEFSNFIFNIKDNIENIDVYINNLEVLDEIGIDTINLESPNKNYIYIKGYEYGNSFKKLNYIHKTFSDGNLKTIALNKDNTKGQFPYENYFIKYDNPTYVLEVENYLSGKIKKKLTLKSFDLPLYNLPSIDEINAFDDTKEIKKRLLK